MIVDKGFKLLFLKYRTCFNNPGNAARLYGNSISTFFQPQVVAKAYITVRKGLNAVGPVNTSYLILL